MLPPPPPARRHVGGAPCGCCYAFGGMAGVEAANTLYTGELTTLSEQEIVSCDELDYGCDGGLVCVHVCVCVCVCVHVCVRVCGVLCWVAVVWWWAVVGAAYPAAGEPQRLWLARPVPVTSPPTMEPLTHATPRMLRPLLQAATSRTCLSGS